MRTLTVYDIEPSDLPKTGALEAVGLRPSRSVKVRETYCRSCDASDVAAARIVGRWDVERMATAIPFDPVAVFMTCGCVIGDPTLAEPHAPTTTDETRTA